MDLCVMQRSNTVSKGQDLPLLWKLQRKVEPCCGFSECLSKTTSACTVDLQWLEHLWDHENIFETVVVRANEC